MIPFFRKTRIVLLSVGITLYVSIHSLIVALFDKNGRSSVDRRLRSWSAFLLNQVRITYSVFRHHHFEILEDRPYAIMSNHSSLYDIPILLVSLPGSIRMLVKKELMRIPVWGRAMRSCEFISIDRQNRQQAFEDLDRARKAMKDGIILWISPEGTRSKDGKLLPFKSGAFRLAIDTELIIIPVGIRGANEILPAKSLDFRIGRHIEVHVGRPVDASLYTVDTRGQLLQKVEGEIRRLMGQER